MLGVEEHERSSSQVSIRPEAPTADGDVVTEVLRDAFGGPEEAALVKALRSGSAGAFYPELALVATMKNEEKDAETIVGYISFSRAEVLDSSGRACGHVLALAPVAVSPRFQRRGIGSQLIRHALAIVRRDQERYPLAVVVVGHAEYYPKFGFKPARQFGLEAPFPVDDESFMVLEVKEGILSSGAAPRGLLRYAPAFATVS
ncbi:putative N-acetyltransferase YhbS [Balamuthia mandrillaris]